MRRNPLPEQIEWKRELLAATKPRSERRVQVYRDLVKLVVAQLKREVRMDRKAS